MLLKKDPKKEKLLDKLETVKESDLKTTRHGFSMDLGNTKTPKTKIAFIYQMHDEFSLRSFDTLSKKLKWSRESAGFLIKIKSKDAAGTAKKF